MKNQKFTITKKIAKHGNQAVIVIPKLFEKTLKPGAVVEVSLEVIDGGKF